MRARDRLVGCLLGGAIGDALGSGIEFHSLDEIRDQFGPQGVTGFVPAYGRLGAITDDTQMTLFTAEGLLRTAGWAGAAGGIELTESLLRAYLRWLMTQREETVSDAVPEDGWLLGNDMLWYDRAPGVTCLSALRDGGFGAPGGPRNDSKGCGGVMRVAPLAVLGAGAFAAAAEAAALTHGHPSGYLSAGALAGILGHLLHGRPLPEAVEASIAILRDWPGQEETSTALERAVEAAATQPPGPDTVEPLGAGWVGEEALAIAVFCALVAGDARTGMLLAVNHSGDSDSTGAIAGNLLGAVHGLEGLPADLLEQLEARDLIERLATTSPTRPSTVLHPTRGAIRRADRRP